MEARFDAQPLWRGVAAREPSRDFFGGLADFGEWQAVNELAGLWDPLTPGPRGNLAAFAPGDWATGPGSVFLMAPFAFKQPGRFGDGTYGVLHAALEAATAIVELAHSRARFLRKGHNPRELLDNQLLTLAVTGRVEDRRRPGEASRDLFDPEDWRPAQVHGAQVRSEGCDGIVYPSVRRPEGTCLAGFRPTLFDACRTVGTVQFYWDGRRLQGPEGLRA